MWKEDKSLQEKGIILTRQLVSELLKNKQAEANSEINDNNQKITIKLIDNTYRIGYLFE